MSNYENEYQDTLVVCGLESDYSVKMFWTKNVGTWNKDVHQLHWLLVSS